MRKYEALRNYLYAKGIKQIDICEYLKVTPVTFREKIDGKTDWKFEETKAISKYLKLDQKTYNELFNIFFE